MRARSWRSDASARRSRLATKLIRRCTSARGDVLGPDRDLHILCGRGGAVLGIATHAHQSCPRVSSSQLIAGWLARQRVR